MAGTANSRELELNFARATLRPHQLRITLLLSLRTIQYHGNTTNTNTKYKKQEKAMGTPYNARHGKWTGFEAPEDLVTRSSTHQYGRLMSTVVGAECTVDE